MVRVTTQGVSDRFRAGAGVCAKVIDWSARAIGASRCGSSRPAYERVDTERPSHELWSAEYVLCDRVWQEHHCVNEGHHAVSAAPTGSDGSRTNDRAVPLHPLRYTRCCNSFRHSRFCWNIRVERPQRSSPPWNHVSE